MQQFRVQTALPCWRCIVTAKERSARSSASGSWLQLLALWRHGSNAATNRTKAVVNLTQEVQGGQ